MSVLVVIPCLNEEAHIERLIRQVVAEPPSLPHRFVIADGGSIDQTRQIAQALAAEFPNVLYLSNPRRLQSSAINLAVENYGVDASFLIRLDAHSEYPENYLQILIDEAETIGAASVVVAMETVAIGGFQRAVAAAQNSKLGNGGSAHRSFNSIGKYVDHGHHALMRIDAFKAVGGYDENFSHNEDAELDIRLISGGYKIWLTGKTYLKYYPRDNPISLLRQYIKYGQGRAATIIKHQVRPKLRQLAPAAVLPALLLAALAPYAGILAFPLLVWATICTAYGLWLGFKTKDPVIGLAAGPAAMIMHLGWSIGFWQRMLNR